MQFRLRQLSWAGALVVALSGVLAGSQSAAAGSPVATGTPPEATAGSPEANSDPIYESLIEARGDREPSHPGPLSIDDIRRILNDESKKALFDGTVAGWRLAPDQILDEEGLSRNLSRDCSPELAEKDTATDLDFTLTYVPADIEIRENPEVAKWVCGGHALSVTSIMTLDTPLGEGTLMVYRAIWGQRELDLMAPFDRVTEGTIGGAPAIFVEPAEPRFGLGTGQIIVIEDDTGPEYVVLRVFADNGIPFDELVRLAEGIR
jgi:hypothetical protein